MNLSALIGRVYGRIPEGRRRHNTVHFFFQAEDGIRYYKVTGVQTCALPICHRRRERQEFDQLSKDIPGKAHLSKFARKKLAREAGVWASKWPGASAVGGKSGLPT